MNTMPEGLGISAAGDIIFLRARRECAWRYDATAGRHSSVRHVDCTDESTFAVGTARRLLSLALLHTLVKLGDVCA